MNEREAMAILVSAQKIGYAVRGKALETAGSAMELLADPHAYAHVLGETGILAIRDAMKDADRLLAFLEETGTKLVIRSDAEYPRLLEHIANPPHLLFVMGEKNLNDPFPFSIVGTRRASAYGLRHTRAIGRELANAGMTIVSGMAAGVDAAAHWGALDAGGRTIAVLGAALDKPYPAENRALMQKIIESGGSVISEYPPGTAPTRYSFIQRNRIVASMSLGVLVSEAPMRSGALSTARMALDGGREVFAIPGDIDRPGSQLPNLLISEGAHMVTCPGDILSRVVIEPDAAGKKTAPKKEAPKKEAPKKEAPKKEIPKKEEAQPQTPLRGLDPNEQAVYDLLLTGDMDFDALSERSGIAADELGGVLMMMELDGIVSALPGLHYRLA